MEIGRRYQPSVTVVASVGGFVPKPHTPFQWFGQDTRGRAPSQGAPAARRRPGGSGASPSAGTTPRPRRPRGSPAGATGGSAPVIERVWRAGGTFQEWSERFDLGLWEEALAAEGLSLDEVVHRDRDRRRGSALGPHLGRPAPRLPAGTTGSRPWPTAGLEDCRWTPCYDCGACTGFGLEHVVASPVPPAGGSQGTGQDLASAGGSRCASSPPPPAAGRAMQPAGPAARPAAVPLRQAGQDPLHQPPRRGPDVGAGPAAQRAAGGLVEGFSPRPLLSFGLALPTGAESLGEYLDVRLEARGNRRARLPSTRPSWPGG